MPTSEQLKLRRQKILDHTEEIRVGSLEIANVPKNLIVDVLVLALSRNVITVDQVPPRYAEKVFLGYVKDASNRQRDDAAERGTEVHSLAERITNGEKVEIPSELTGHVHAWRCWKRDYGMTFVENEFTVYSKRYYYAGTGDFLGYSSRHPEWGLICGDYKTSESGIWPDIALQLSAIRGAEFIGRPDNTEDRSVLPKIKTFIGVQITGKGYRVVPADVTEATFRIFLSAANVARWKRDFEKFALDESNPFVSTQGEIQ